MPPATPDDRSAPTSPAPAPTKQPYPGVANYTRVSSLVACGGTTEVATLSLLKRDGFKSVINLRMPNEPGADLERHEAAARELALTHIHIPFASGSPDPRAVDRFLDVMSDTALLPVYIHCVSANRVGAMWLAKRVLQDDCPLEQATAEARTIGLSSATLEAFVLQYIAALPQ